MQTPPTTEAAAPVIAVGPAFGTWSAGWVAGTVIAAPIVVSAFGVSLGDDLTIPQLAVVSLVTWSILVGALFIASRRAGTGSMVRDYAVAFRPIDVVGVPIGILTQLALVPLLYWPLRRAWPDTFRSERIEERAQDLADMAGGWRSVLLAVVVVVGAPVVEELVYRGLLQRSVSAVVGRGVGLVSTSLWFALIHFSAVEYPGLLLAGLVFGSAVVATGRIGPAIIIHAAFNATGLFVVLSDRV